MLLGSFSLCLIALNALSHFAIPDEIPATSERHRLKEAESLLERLYAKESSKSESAVSGSSSIVAQLIVVAERLEDDKKAERWRTLLDNEPPKEIAIEGDIEGDENSESIWSYLIDKYDRNEDGKIEKTEYGRDPASFARLDVNRDGQLSSRDFEFSGSSGRSSRIERESMSSLMGQLVLSTHFQTDDEEVYLRIEELEDSFYSFDQDENGEIDQDEFARESFARGLTLPDDINRLFGEVAPFRILLSAVDHDESDSLTFKEIDSLYVQLDEDRDGTWEVPSLEAITGRDDVVLRGALSVDNAPNSEGKKAPDFKLKSLDREEEVLLSSFAGDRPVALIFGSYT